MRVNSRKVLIHSCCGPCATGVMQWSSEIGNVGEVSYLFYNPNIHPYLEHKKRRDSFVDLMKVNNNSYYVIDDYSIDNVFSWQNNCLDRCEQCYIDRLVYTARVALEKGYDSFTSTLLISPYQKHDMLKNIGEEIADKTGVKFYYVDYRPYFNSTRDLSRDADLYRQKYCGCIYSEYERYSPKKVSCSADL